MFHFQTVTGLPERYGGRGMYGGGLVESNGIVFWGRGGVNGGRVYRFNQSELSNVTWERVISDGVEYGSRLAASGGRLVVVGGLKGAGVVEYIKKVQVWDEQKWNPMVEMPVGCAEPCVVSADGGGLIVMGGQGLYGRSLNTVQVYDVKKQAWFMGPPLPLQCQSMSAVVHGDLVFIMGGNGMGRAVWCASISEMTAAHTHDRLQSWGRLPDVPYCSSSVCTVDGVLLALGEAEGQSGSRKFNTIYGFHPIQKVWQHVGDMPFECSFVDSLLMTDNSLLVADGDSQKVLKITVEGLAALFPNERTLYEEAMTKGYVEISVIKCLILGAAGVGKTHLKHLLLKKDPPQQRISTGLADNPVRAISFSLAGVGGQDGDDWFAVEDDKALMNVIGGTIRGGMSITSSLDTVVRTLPKMTAGEFNGDVVDHPDPIPNDVKISEQTSQQSKALTIEDELIHNINHSSDKVFGMKWIQLIDSGGQLQYHDILPLFIQNTSVMIFVFKLSEELSHHPTIHYYGADGKAIIKPYQSVLSHKQILHHSLRSICTHNSHPLIVTVGTHRDIENGCKETLEEKNQQIISLLSPLTCKLGLLHKGEDLKEVVFAVNAKAPQNEDQHVAKILREEIISMSPQSTKLPIAWFGLEILLQRAAHDGVLSLAECKVYAERLFIKGDMFTAALHHLVYHHVFLYYPEVLPNTIFCDPQVVLTKVTELVQYHHKLRDNPDKSVAARSDITTFRDHGLLSLELLRKFTKHYIEYLFTPQNLLDLLMHLHVIAIIRNGEYLMPALLPHLDSENMSQYLQQSTSLIIRPTEGCIPSGLFCCLVAYLLSPINESSWKVCMNRGKPLCLYRNCISFVQTDSTEVITLVDMFSYIQVHINEASIELCGETRDCIFKGIKNACCVLKYHDIQFEDAFVCKGANCASDPPHVSVVVHPRSTNRSVYKWKCTIIENQWGYLNEDQLMWIEKKAVKKRKVEECSSNDQASNTAFKRQKHMSDQLFLDSEPSLPLLMNTVAAKIPSKFEAIGLQLGLTQEQLQAIRPRNQCLQDYHRAFVEIFGTWRRHGLLPYTWRTIIDVLKCAAVDEVPLSKQLTSMMEE